MNSSVQPSGPRTILIVEDEPKLASLLTDYLVNDDFDTVWLADGSTVLPWLAEHHADLMLLDILLPGKNGFDICRELRATSTLPVIMLTARIEEIDRLLGLEIGADDYICKPFSPKEVVARVKAVLRRTTGGDPKLGEPGTFEIDDEGQQIRLNGQALDLTPTEFRLLRLLAAHPGRVYPRDRLLDVLHDDFRDVTDRAIDSHIKNLRKKIARIEPEREIIVSVYGVGYKAEP